MAGRPVLVAAALLVLAALVPGPVGGPTFATSDLCMSCHNGLATRAGEDVSFGFSWRTGMMANSSRDPYWQASVRREIMDHPVAAGAIENECSRCHMPLANETARSTGASGEVFAHLPVGAALTPMALMAADGVSCLACHAATGDGQGTEGSFTGGFALQAAGNAFGPYEIDHGRAGTMQSSSGFRPTTSGHMAQAEFCATCHTLVTHSLDADGEVIGELPEQVPFLEWKHSSYVDAAPCQECHMPVVQEETALTSVLPQARSGMNRHVFLGGNSFIQRTLGMNAAELGVAAPARDLATAATGTEGHLSSGTATISVREARIEGGRLIADVSVENYAGHKLPTAYPSRRAWIELRVTGAGGSQIFSSGAPLNDGSIEGNDNDLDSARFEPHFTVIESADQVQIYESILQGPDGAVTTGLLTATGFVKDNRLLPDGFEKETAEERVAVHGRAVDDPDFDGGGDRVRYAVDLQGATGPFTVRATLWFQSVGFRWAHNLAAYDATEPQRFVRMYERLSETAATKISQVALTVD